ncbi:MAG: DNA-directed RNA polymerase subunit omega [Oscillospiraceae bacterium]|nr:DNA-directed RNA polymerase subunit omega [Oscillospiraceae bacterium]
MLKPSAELTKDLKISTYSLVVGIAKRAREIAVDAEIRGEILTDKPVDMAVQEYIDHDFEIIETEPCEECGRLDCICDKKEAPKQEADQQDAPVEEAPTEA